MDGLDDQAEASVEGLIQQLYSSDIVEIKHSSRDTAMVRITDALKDAQLKKNDDITALPIVTKSLVFRSGVSIAGLQMLQQALNIENCPIEELEFVCIRSVQELLTAINCCRQGGATIRRLSLKNYRPSNNRLRLLGQEGYDAPSETIRDAVFGSLVQYEDEDEELDVDGSGQSLNFAPLESLHTLEIVNFPLGTSGAEILADSVAKNKTLTTLRLMDCDLRSDSANAIATMIKGNTSLRTLDLSYNRHYLGSEIRKEMTLKTLVQKGLRYNLSLMELIMYETRGSPLKRGKIDRQLAINRFRATAYTEHDPFSIPATMWPYILAKVSAKPSALHLFLQDSAFTLFR